MEFDKLSDSEKRKHWREVEEDIKKCMALCADSVSEDLEQKIHDYLSHNELGLALELLTESAIEFDWALSKETRQSILRAFRKMDYHKNDRITYESYENWLNVT